MGAAGKRLTHLAFVAHVAGPRAGAIVLVIIVGPVGAPTIVLARCGLAGVRNLQEWQGALAVQLLS